jgi:hypothetical protein
VLANQPQWPEWTYLSQTGFFTNFDYQEPAKEDDSTDFGVASKQYEEIRNVTAIDESLIILSSGTEWVAQDMSGGPVIGNSAVFLRSQSFWGSSWLDCLTIGTEVVYQGPNGYPIRVMEGKSGKWESRDLSLFAGLTSDFPIIGWCYQRDPHRLIWGYDANGALYTLTFDQETETYAWAKHGLSGGRVRSLCSIPENGEDVVYMVVERTKGTAGASVVYSVERMRPRRDDNPSRVENNYLDCATHFDNSNSNRANRIRLSGSSSVGSTVVLYSESAAFAAGDASSSHRVVLHPKDGARSIRIRITVYTSATQVTGVVESNPVDSTWPKNPTGLVAWMAGSFPSLPPWSPVVGDISGTVLPMDQSDWGIAKFAFTVPSTIDAYTTGQVVKADGAVVPFTLVGTALTLSTAAVFVTLGLPYTQVVESLDVPAQPTATGNIEIILQSKVVKKAAFQIARTSPGFSVGDSPTGSLTTWQPDAGDTSTAEFGPGSEDQTYSGLAYVPVFGDWNRYGRICLVNTAPFPVTISSIIREVNLGGS